MKFEVWSLELTFRKLTLAVGLASILGTGLNAEIIDRTLAVVEGSIITQSDVLAATNLARRAISLIRRLPDTDTPPTP